MDIASITRIRGNNLNNTWQATWIGFGNLISLLFSIISSAILSRYLIKADYGTYKQVLYIYNTLLVMFSFGLPRAYSYFLAQAPIEEGLSIIKKINGIFWIIGAIFSLLLYFGAGIFSILLNNQDLEFCLKLFAISPLFLLPTMGVEGIMATYKKAHINAVYVFFTRVFSLVCVVFPVLLFEQSVYIAIVGFVVSAILTYFLGYYLELRLFKGYKKIKSKLSLKKIFAFALPLFFVSIWGLMMISSNQFFISRYWGSEVFAEFSNGFIELPFASMIISAVAAVLLPTFSKMVHDKIATEAFLELWQNVFIKSAKLIYPLAIFFCVFAPELMLFLYGNQYSNSSIYFQMMLIINLTRVVPFVPLLIAIGKVKAYAKIQMLTALLVIIFEYISVRLFETPYMIAFVYIFCFLFYIISLLKVLADFFNTSLVSLIPYKKLCLILFLSMVTCIIVKIILSFLPDFSALAVLFIGFMLFIVLYLGLCRIYKLSYMDIILSFINGRNEK